MKDRIVAVGYRRLPDATPRRARAPWTIARWALALAWRRRATKVVLGLCAVNAAIHGFVLIALILVQGASQSVGSAGPLGGAEGIERLIGNAQEALSSFVSTQSYFTVIALAVIGAGLIAEDRRCGALDLYFSRPLRLADYLLGKAMAAGAVPLLTIVLPFVALWLLAVGVSPPILRLSLLWLLIPGLIGACLASAVLTATLLGASALGDRGRTIGVVFVFAWLILGALGSGLASNGIAAAGYISPDRDVSTMIEALVGAGPPSAAAAALKIRGSSNPSALLSALALLGYGGLGAGALVLRLRREVAE